MLVKNKKEKPKGKATQEWFKQADYDIKTAQVMFDNKRYIYAVFMCNLAIEKALKGLYAHRLNATPPKTHNLMFLIEKTMLEVPAEQYDFLFFLNGVSVPTRYPEELQKLRKEYNKAKTEKLLGQSKETLKWLKARLKE